LKRLAIFAMVARLQTGLKANPVLDSRPTLASQGIDMQLAHQGRLLGRLSGTLGLDTTRRAARS